MRSMAVVVIDVLVEHQVEVVFSEDDQPVQSLVAQSLDHPLAMAVRPRTAIRCQSHPGALAAEHVVEVTDKLGIAIVDEELDRGREIL